MSAFTCRPAAILDMVHFVVACEWQILSTMLSRTRNIANKQTNKKSTRRSEVESDEQTDRLDKRGVRMCERRRGD